MMRGAAVFVVAIALILPAFGQHSGGHGGSAGRGGSMGHAGSGGRHTGFSANSGYSGRAGFSGSRISGRIASPRYGGFARPTMPVRFGFGVPNRGLRQHRPLYQPALRNRYGSRNRDRGRRRGYGVAFGYGYPGYGYPYPYVIDPGFYDWGDTSDNDDDRGESVGYAPDADNGAPYADSQQGYYPQSPYTQDANASQQPSYGPPYQQQSPHPQSYAQAAAPESAEEPITVIFKDGRASKAMRNYMMTSTVLTDVDPQHFERIPLDEIDIPATERINRKHGIDFEVPGGMR